MVLLSKVQVVALHGSDDRQSVSEVLRRVESVVTGMAKEYIEKEAFCLMLYNRGMRLLDEDKEPVLAGTLHAVEKMAHDFPAADVRENVVGEWIQHYETTSDNETLPYGWECSLCGRWEMEKQPFCNCGAVMKGGNDGDNLDS